MDNVKPAISVPFTYVQRARQSGNPVIGGNRTTFICEGDSAPQLISDLHDMDERPKPFKRISSRIWACSLTLPQDSYP